MAAALRVEDIKREGIKVNIDLLAASGFESISEADRYRLKTQGICAQRQSGVFMLRIRVPGGKASAAQMRRVAALSRRYGHGSVHITTRGGLELHHVTIEDVPAVFSELADVGLTTKGTCGDTIRNVVACAHAGTYAGEVIALSPFLALLHEHIVSISDETNISRKMNVAIACSPTCDDHVATTDIGFVATPSSSGAAPGFALWGAGGLGAAPRLAIKLADWLPQEDVLPAFSALVAIAEKYGDRTNRAKAKIKMLVEKWGDAEFVRVFNEELSAARTRGLNAVRGEALSGPAIAPAELRLGSVTEQKQTGYFTIPGLVPMGELSAGGADALADAAERFGDGVVHLTPEQNAELQFVASKHVDAAAAALETIGLKTQGRGGIADVVACVGLEYCALAIAGSMTMGDEIARAMDARRKDPRYADFRIHVSGCPHSCAKHQVADIGLAGGSQEIAGVRTEMYALYLGGNAHQRQLGTVLPKKVERHKVLGVIDALLEFWEKTAEPDERFSATVARLGAKTFMQIAQRAASGKRPPVSGGKLIVIGNGMAGARFLEELRERESAAYTFVVYGDEKGGNYNRIMLSAVLGGTRAPDDIVTHPAKWYAERGIELRAGVRIKKIDRARRVVIDQHGGEEDYDVLVLATGSRPFMPPIEGIKREGVYVFRTLSDVAAIRERAAGVTNAVVLGGGLLGLEAASGLREMGVNVTVVHLAPWLMEQQLGRDAGEALLPRIKSLGINVITEARATGIEGDISGITGVRLVDGRLIEGSLVIACCGIIPNADLAKEAGIAVNRAIMVDDELRTSDDAIFALGECVEHRGVTYGLVEPLWDQARILAQALTGSEVRYEGSRIGTKLKVAGVNVVSLGERMPGDGDEAMAARWSDGSFRSLILRDGKLVGAQVVGDGDAAALIAQAFARNAPLAGDPSAFILKSIGKPPIDDIQRGDRRVCVCNDILQSSIVEAIQNGAKDVAEIGRVTCAGTGCGSCRGEIAALVIEHDGRHQKPAVVVAATPATLPPPGTHDGGLRTTLLAHLLRELESIAATPGDDAAALGDYAERVGAVATLLRPKALAERA